MRCEPTEDHETGHTDKRTHLPLLKPLSAVHGARQRGTDFTSKVVALVEGDLVACGRIGESGMMRWGEGVGEVEVSGLPGGDATSLSHSLSYTRQPLTSSSHANGCRQARDACAEDC